MAHEIQENDGLVLKGEGAWHGLGLTVDHEFTPKEGLIMGGLNWNLVQRPVYTKDKAGNDILVPTHLANYREDLDSNYAHYFGMVSSKYVPIQNSETADFCEALLEEGEGKVTCETVGSIRNGALVWFLLKGECFAIKNKDEIFPYVLVSNGHDGQYTYRVTPTTVRVVCSNTAHMVIPRFDRGELGQSAISIRHTVNVMSKVQEARRALKHYHETLEANRKLYEKLASVDIKTEDMKQFFVDSYTLDFGAIPANPTCKVEENQRARALSAYQSFTRRFDDEKSLAGTTWWNCFNAYSGMILHDQKARGKDDVARVEKRTESNMFGLNQERTQAALQRAFKASMAG